MSQLDRYAQGETLAAFPERGTRRDDVRSGLWIIGFERRVVIAYMILDTGDVEIGRIFYGGRDYEAIMRELGFSELRISTRGLRFAAIMD